MTSKRMTVAQESVDQNGVLIMPNALVLSVESEGRIPVNWNGQPEKLIGFARDLQRERNNVTMEIELFDDIFLDLDDKIGAYAYVNPFTGHSDYKRRLNAIVQIGTIQRVYLKDLE